MNTQSVDITALPIATHIAAALKKIFASDDIDLNDIVTMAYQDPVLLANIILLVNQFFQDKGRPVVNTVSAAINLLGLSVLSKALLSLTAAGECNLTSCQSDKFDVIRNRIIIAAHMTKYWAEYMGERNTEEQFCVSMFTGLTDLSQVIHQQPYQRNVYAKQSCLDTADGVMNLYHFDNDCIPRLPDSIQQVHQHTSCNRRLNLSVLCYELVSALELGYSSLPFNNCLKQLVDCIDQSLDRAAYDFSIQLVAIEKSLRNKSFSHAAFLVATNITAIDPFEPVN